MNSFTTHILIGFGGGVASFAHCVGMCGGFVLHLAADRTPGSSLRLQALWHLARIATYALAGTVAGLAGHGLLARFPAVPHLQNLLGWVAGGAMIVAGLAMLGLLPVRMQKNISGSGLLAGPYRLAITAPPPARAILLGMLAGLLPCPIVLSVLGYAVQTGSPAAGLLTMVGMGCGTLLPLLLVQAAGGWVQLRDWGATVGAVVLILIGVGTALRGSDFYHLLLGCPPRAVSGRIPAEAAPNTLAPGRIAPAGIR